MWKEIFMAVLGFCSGVTIAGGVVGFVIGLSITPRYAGITHTAKHLLLYEDSMLLGTIFGTWFGLFSPDLLFIGTPFLLFYGFFSGMFLGGWILALEEMANILPILSRRIKLTNGISKIILCIAIGKTLGSLIFFHNGW